MKVSLPSNEDERQKMAMDKSMKDSRDMQNLISSGADIVGRPQDEGYRPYVSPEDRDKAEGGDAKVAERAGQFGEAGTSRVVKPSKPASVTKEQMAKEGFDNLRDYLNAQQGLKRRKEKDPTAGDSSDKKAQEAADAIDPGRDMRTPRYTPPGSAPKQTTQKPKPKVFMPSKPDNSFQGSKFKSGGSVSSASRRADGIATKGKTRGKMC